MESEKKSGNYKGLIVLIFLLIILVLGLGGYIVYDKMISSNSNNSKTNNTINNNSNDKEEVSYNSYNIGDKVTVELNDSTGDTFYVLKQSTEKEEDVVLFAEKNIGTGAFNNDSADGNDYKGSLIESRLNELTSSWTNVKEKRLITVDEIIATGLTSKKQCGPSENDLCDSISEDSWLRYNGEMYWTSTKATDHGNYTYDEGKYVLYVDLDGVISAVIVGIKPGSTGNLDGHAYDYYGIRPVIVISKKYVK